ncbi:hypothetical protein [Phyllobacterium endophyticum]|jgi:hypothetical protein|uniref:hypothetical protein n=1 Tax=Phyllobacterium endophyticum TaxID=1149773 RepID=UPI0011CB7053|nr:hypothetical protein [Phyllobacterium endophyticum]TXR51152.1 hypothetical protein FVA77_01420 [Phyllobacterium endophyticum]
MKTSTIAIAVIISLGVLAGCQTKSKPGPGSLAFASEKAALPTMERVAIAANNCWFKSGDKSFKPYRLAPELNSFSGRPRILVVPASNPGGRPLLVVHAEGNPAKVEAFGPLMSNSSGNRIASDVRRWADGQTSCGASG